jgi:hypothetical protein
MNSNDGVKLKDLSGQGNNTGLFIGNNNNPILGEDMLNGGNNTGPQGITK